MKKICIVTGTRAEFGLLRPLIQLAIAKKTFKVLVAVTGAHLSKEQGETYREIEQENIPIAVKIPILEKDGKSVPVWTATALAVERFGEYFASEKPDMVVLLGDRYEILGAATAAMFNNVPIAHIHGGESTEGAIDEAIRHSVTKMSYLHFTSCEAYRRRVIQLGESADRVFNVGALGVENIEKLTLLNQSELQESIHFMLDRPYFVVTYHPVTLDRETPERQMAALLDAIEEHRECKVIFTKANADAGGEKINEMIDGYVAAHAQTSIAFESMGYLRYLSAMKYCAAVVGNTSSGIIEAPSFGVPTVNIGDRQKGRIQAASIINCAPQKEQISAALKTALSPEFRKKAAMAVNPYGGKNTAETIYKVIAEYLGKDKLTLKKVFNDIL